MTAVANRKRARKNEMLASERKKLQQLVEDALKRWGAERISKATCNDRFLHTRYGRLYVSNYTAVEHGGGPWIAMCFDDPDRARYLGRGVNPHNGKWNFHFFGRVSAAEAFSGWRINVEDILHGDPVLAPPPPPVFAPIKPLPLRDPSYVSPFEGETVELCSGCLKSYNRPRGVSLDLCLCCAGAKIAEVEEERDQAIQGEESALGAVSDARKEVRTVWDRAKDLREHTDDYSLKELKEKLGELMSALDDAWRAL